MSDKKFPVYTAADLIKWLRMTPIEGDNVRAEYLARATEVVNAIGTDDVEEVRAQVQEIEWLRDAVDDHQARIDAIYSALGTSDLDEMRKMRESHEWLKLVQDRGLVLREDDTSDE